ncbi:hypothetical protein CARUB_v10024078mg [Capsella rubella]|uniref:Pectinesterase inhibitor domain-containing protein n=1 Tax=Capsella rubella TaxID=81985 RepID=R0HRH5_9BRAS|nr:pectinesterase inhibitor 6 [Capsella rubella]EOA27905.1 hypothetical protein CARUB_v10024078mg [Capsella rubella]
MTSSSITLTLLLLCIVLAVSPNPSLALSSSNKTEETVTRYSTYVRNACSVTQYQRLCVRKLWPFAIVARNKTSKWTRASVAVTITDTKRILRVLLRTRGSAVEERERIALSDCRELFVDSLDNLYKSLAVLRTLNADEFQRQMSDLATWLSAALTDEDTCLDGFEETSSRSRTVRMVRRKATKCMQLCSNALALLNKLSSDGF